VNIALAAVEGAFGETRKLFVLARPAPVINNITAGTASRIFKHLFFIKANLRLHSGRDCSVTIY
jgi:hypothetical protein